MLFSYYIVGVGSFDEHIVQYIKTRPTYVRTTHTVCTSHTTDEFDDIGGHIAMTWEYIILYM